MKLMAKSPEDRYQTAAGLEHDLRRCLGQWEAHCDLDEFSLADGDASDRLRIPEKLYGREREIATLLASLIKRASLASTSSLKQHSEWLASVDTDKPTR